MNLKKIKLIIFREYWERVRKKSFIVMSILGPLLIAAFFAFVIWMENADRTEHKIMVIDDSYIFRNNIADNSFTRFYFPESKLEEGIKEFYETDYTCILWIPANVVGGGGEPVLYYKKAPGIAAQTYITNVMEATLFENKLLAQRIDPAQIKSARESVSLRTEKLYETGEAQETKTGYSMVIGFACGILIFMFIFFYGVQVMRGVMEEKTNRVVEVIISSVQPFELMMGKIIGIAFVGLTQFLIWALLTFTFSSVASEVFFKKMKADNLIYKAQQEEVFKQGSNANFKELQKLETKNEVFKIMQELNQIDFTEIALSFLFYFLFGYLTYSALFAAIGSAVDAEADTQQFMLPVTLPLMLAYIASVNIIQNPESKMAFWFSFIPFTSPIVMMVRLPFGVPLWQILISMSLLVATFFLTTWMAGRIYRAGILMYGKKATWKELGKWVFYKSN